MTDQEKTEVEERKQKIKEFEEAARPLIKYLAENHNPHCTAIITDTNAELVEGKMATGEILDYIKD
jgi:hypothetical protein